ncbi:AhpC/TSA family protein [Planctomyces sp. SH-PL62]|uniref:AhpC/TSA family protein n=1 Tax=Planctomyces sp. SH-PL62 TaxID=1636152 RepID=UPI0012E78E7C|nr:AhpC/TSA family protein [Planctomyces sp. SH-PL62]
MKRIILICVLAAPACAALFVSLASRTAKPAGRPISPSLLGRTFLEGPPALRAIDGRRIDLRPADGGATVVTFLAADDPASDVAADGLETLRESFPPGVVATIAVAVGEGPPREAAGSAVVHDPTGTIARRFGVATTPESLVLVGEARLLHRGRFDLGELREAVAAASRGVEPDAIGEPATGTPIPEPSSARSSPTYTQDVEPILRRSCRDCHRPGEAAPFSLLKYAQAARRSRDLADVVESRFMPPWKPSSGHGPPLLHDRTLLPDEVATLRAWAEAGAPEGPQTAEPVPEPPPVGEWALGTPDLILEMPEPFEIPPTGGDVYRCFVLPTDLPEDRWIRAIEVKPGNPRVVHHTFGYLDVRGLGRSRDEADEEPGYMCFSGFDGDSIFGALGGWTPGNEPHFYGDGVGQKLPQGADLVLQIHYHPIGKVERDQTRLGIHFARKPVKKALQWVSACADPAEFVIPADDPDVRWKAELKIPMDVDLHAMTPHMHMLGRSMAARVVTPDGRSRPLIRIDDWDFNRQDTYFLREPLRIPEGSTVHLEARFDNSSGNPRNPSRPPREVRWGEGTNDDMMILFLGLTHADQDLTVPGAVDDFMEEFFRRAGVAPSDAVE